MNIHPQSPSHISYKASCARHILNLKVLHPCFCEVVLLTLPGSPLLLLHKPLLIVKTSCKGPFHSEGEWASHQDEGADVRLALGLICTWVESRTKMLSL